MRFHATAAGDEAMQIHKKTQAIYDDLHLKPASRHCAKPTFLIAGKLPACTATRRVRGVKVVVQEVWIDGVKHLVPSVGGHIDGFDASRGLNAEASREISSDWNIS